jgi:hypothetical protein
MNKRIPKRVINKAADRLLAGRRNRSREYGLETLYVPGTKKVSNKFFKNPVSKYVYKCSCSGCLDGKLASTRRKIEKLSCDLNDYLQEKPKYI